MEVILLERIEKLGQMGDVVKVKDGFARNFLLPQKKALRASEDNLAYFEKERVTLEANNLKQKQEAEIILDKLDKFNLIIIRQAGETGQLYGSVNTNDLKKALDENRFIVEKNQIKLDKPIKELGVHNVSVKLHPEVQAMISVIVSRTNTEADKLIKGDEIELENNESLTVEETINIEEVFEEGAVPENIEESTDDLSEETEDQNTEETNNEINSVSKVFMNTNLAAAAGVVVAAGLTRVVYGKTDVVQMLNGALGGLVAITAEPLMPSPIIAIIVGGIGGAIVVFGSQLLIRMQIDDVVGAIPVHMFAGIWGTLAVVISNTEVTLGAQVIGILAVNIFVFVTSFIVWTVLKSTIGIRISEEAEKEGTDKVEIGVTAYMIRD